MAYRDDDPWQLPPSVRGEDFRLGSRTTKPLSTAAKARLRRIVNRTPEVMVKVTGRSRGGAGHLKAHLDYITRNGRVHAETQDGEHITDRDRLRHLHDVWMSRNEAEARGKPQPNAAQSVNLILSMPAGTPPDRVEAAGRTWARETFSQNHDWLMARHDDTDHAHVHITVRAVGIDGRRLSPGPEALQQWRERFARELRRLGVEAEATPRQARGAVHKQPSTPVHQTLQRGSEPRVRLAERREAGDDARAPKPPQPRDWSRDIQARQDSIRRAYLGHADELVDGDRADRQLARDIQRFVAEMPIPLTRRQAMAVELRHLLEQRADRGRLSEATPDPSNPLQRSQIIERRLTPSIVEPSRKR